MMRTTYESKTLAEVACREQNERTEGCYLEDLCSTFNVGAGSELYLEKEEEVWN